MNSEADHQANTPNLEDTAGYCTKAKQNTIIPSLLWQFSCEMFEIFWRDTLGKSHQWTRTSPFSVLFIIARLDFSRNSSALPTWFQRLHQGLTNRSASFERWEYHSELWWHQDQISLPETRTRNTCGIRHIHESSCSSKCGNSWSILVYTPVFSSLPLFCFYFSLSLSLSLPPPL